ncbi:MAG TPA: hypothetical protein VL181_08750, partial [Holophagaceae bacterium]|nr:hypothetical protein [Holophagaceae bacterium]
MDRRLCPSCQTRLSPLAMECPTCGLAFTRAERPRPLLFQATGLSAPVEAPRAQALQAPALGRIQPLPLSAPEMQAPALPGAASSHPLDFLGSALETFKPDPQVASFGPLLLVEAGEACLLAALNLALALALSLALQAPVGRIFAEAWPVVLPAHLLVSWAALMVPLVMAGQSPLMGHWNLVLAEDEPERRMVFSLLHLLSVALFPLSFLCMVLSPRHQTLAEYLTGQEIISRPEPRL